MIRVLYIPGLPGSELREPTGGGASRRVFPPRLSQIFPRLDPALRLRLQGPDDLSPAQADGIQRGEPIGVATRFLGFDLMKQAKSLYDILERIGIGPSEILRFGWDWRRPVTDDALPTSAVTELSARLAGLPAPLPVIVHSTGALLLRSCLEKNPDLAARVSKILAFGAPWLGTLKPLAVLVGQQGFGPIRPGDAQEVFTSCWSAFDVLPRATGAGLTVDSAGNEVDLLADPSWTTALANDPQGLLAARITRRAAHSLANLGTPAPPWTLPIDVVNVVGWGKKTLVQAVRGVDGGIAFQPAGLDNEAADDAEDGCITRNEAHHQGDGTVPLVSAAGLTGDRVTTCFVPIGALASVHLSNRRHSELWRNPGGEALLRHHLVGGPAPVLAFAAVDWSDKLNPGDPVRLRYVMQNADGTPLPGAAPRVVRTTGGDIPLPVASDGRGFVELGRGAFPKTGSGRFRRVVVELAWEHDAAPQQQAMFIEP